MYVDDDYVLSLKDAPLHIDDNGDYYRWNDDKNNLLNNHQVSLNESGVTTLTGSLSKITNGVSNGTLEDNYYESLNPEVEDISTPDTDIHLNSYAYSKDSNFNVKLVDGRGAQVYAGDSSSSKKYLFYYNQKNRSSKIGYKDGLTADPTKDVFQVNTKLMTLTQELYDEIQKEKTISLYGKEQYLKENIGQPYTNTYPENASSSKACSYNGDSTIGLEDPTGSDDNVYKPSKVTGDAKTTKACTNYVVNKITLDSDVVISGHIALGGTTGFYGANTDFSQIQFVDL